MLKLVSLNFFALSLCSFNTWYLVGFLGFLMSMNCFCLIYSPISSFSYSSIMFSLDNISVNLICLSVWIFTLMALSGQKIFNFKGEGKMFMILICVLNLSLMLTFSMQHLLGFFIFFEASLIPTFLLILGWGYQTERMQAGLYLLMYTVMGSMPLLISLVKMYSVNMSLSIIYSGILWNMDVSYSMVSFWWMMSVLAFLIKTPLFLFHLWLPKAHVEAPVSGSMILAGVLLKLGGYGLIRVSNLNDLLSSKVYMLVISVALIGAVSSSLICFRQTDIKSLIAYSSISHMGLVVLGIMSKTQMGLNSALTLMIAHGLCSSGLFFVSGVLYDIFGTRSLFLMKGVLSVFPMLSVLIFSLVAANMAAPPSINLFSEIFLIMVTMGSWPYSVSALFFISFLAAGYSMMLYTSLSHSGVSSYTNEMLMPKSLELVICMFHILPLYLLIVSPTLIFST
uniref:NADH dehydrogenase subunit 4 n=1 Tax=Antonbruunia milenae TaxID=3053535 RepID=UPI0030DED34B